MPKAAAFLSTDTNGLQRLVDKYDRMDLWTSHSVLGRWEDRDYRLFTVAKLEEAPPIDLSTVELLTRLEYEKKHQNIYRRDEKTRRLAMELLSSVELAEKGVNPKYPIRGYKEVKYFEGTNENAIVCGFLPKDSEIWYLATWEFDGSQDEKEVLRKDFEKRFLAEDFHSLNPIPLSPTPISERSLLARDCKRSVENYKSWQVEDIGEIVVMSDLPRSSKFVEKLKEELPRMRELYKKTWPTKLDTSNTLCVARIFDDKAKYLTAVGEDKEWTAAFWSPERRELVAYLPEDGEGELMKTIRHEAFHQYLSYATAMIPTSPWMNEGYAQYFEEPDARQDLGITASFEEVAKYIPALLQMNYEQFYEGTNLERRFKYRLAWSIAVFIEEGLDEIRNKPFKDFKSDYMKYLLLTKDPAEATARAFKNKEMLDRFLAEYVKFWTK